MLAMKNKMKYFKDNAAKVLAQIKDKYKNDHDEFHKFSMKPLGIDLEKDEFFPFFKKIVLMDVQSRPGNLTKFRVLKIFEAVEENKFFKEGYYKEKYGEGKEKDLVERFEKELLSIYDIGPKIANLIIKNIFYFGDTERYFGIKREKVLPFLKVPVDVHVRNLLCYRLQICPEDLYGKINTENDVFQKELKDLCAESNETTGNNLTPLVPIDLDILWYIGYNNCAKRVFCSMCKISDDCKDKQFKKEAENRKEKMKNKREKEKIEAEMEFVKKRSKEFGF